MKKNLVAAFSGVLFAVGLTVSGMTLPSKVIGFLDFAGAWDASLLLVMVGGLITFGIGVRLATRRGAPLLGGTFERPTLRTIDARLVGGSALFGLGWGIAGFCPGPAIASLGPASLGALIFVGGMAGGQLLFELSERRKPVSAEVPAADSLVCG